MSNLDRKIIIIPEGIIINITENKILISGPLGNLEKNNLNSLKFEINNHILKINTVDNTKNSKKIKGLYYALVNNMIQGVQYGFKKVLIAEGIGFKFKIESLNLILLMGFSHPVILKIPTDIKINLESQIKINITGIDKEKVNTFAKRIQTIKNPEPYKGKGIFFEGESIKRKDGKRSK